jgi:hypothetical protein
MVVLPPEASREVEGTERLDFGGTECPIPEDRVSTLVFDEYLSRQADMVIA